LLQPEKEKAEKTATATAEEANFIHQRIMQNYAKKKGEGIREKEQQQQCEKQNPRTLN